MQNYHAVNYQQEHEMQCLSQHFCQTNASIARGKPSTETQHLKLKACMRVQKMQAERAVNRQQQHNTYSLRLAFVQKCKHSAHQRKHDK